MYFSSPSQRHLAQHLHLGVAWMDVRLPVRRLNESRASTRYGVSLLERSLLICRRSVLLSVVVAINKNQCPVMTAGRLGQTQNHGHWSTGRQQLMEGRVYESKSKGGSEREVLVEYGMLSQEINMAYGKYTQRLTRKPSAWKWIIHTNIHNNGLVNKRQTTYHSYIHIVWICNTCVCYYCNYYY